MVRLEIIQNEMEVQKKISGEIKVNKLRWFGHVGRRNDDGIVKNESVMGWAKD